MGLTEKEKDINYGICILRIIFSFQVVMVHCNGGSFFYWIGSAVPFFMLTSFYLTYNTFNKSNYINIKRRISRICIPYFGYAFISFVIISFLEVITTKHIVSYTDLLWQLLLGSSKLNPPLWFLSNLIICSAIIFLVSKYSLNKNKLFIIILITSFFIQYTGINSFIFSNLRFEIKWPLGRIIEMIPYACAGTLLASSGILKKIHSNILAMFTICILLLFFKTHSIPTPTGFYNQGIQMFINTILVFPLFYLANFEKLNTDIKKFILYISNYSLGIYCIHHIIILIYENITNYSGTSFIRGSTIYILSLFFSILISKIPFKWAASLVR